MYLKSCTHRPMNTKLILRSIGAVGNDETIALYANIIYLYTSLVL